MTATMKRGCFKICAQGRVTPTAVQFLLVRNIDEAHRNHSQSANKHHNRIASGEGHRRKEIGSQHDERGADQTRRDTACHHPGNRLRSEGGT